MCTNPYTYPTLYLIGYSIGYYCIVLDTVSYLGHGQGQYASLDLALWHYATQDMGTVMRYLSGLVKIKT